MATNKLVTSPYLRNHYPQLIHYPLSPNYNRNLYPTPQLTNMNYNNVPAFVHTVEQPEDQRRSPTKLAYDAINYVIQRNIDTESSTISSSSSSPSSSTTTSGHHRYHFYHLPPQTAYAAGDNQTQTNAYLKSDSPYSKLFADHQHQLVRRPSVVLMTNPDTGSSIRVPYTAPVQVPSSSLSSSSFSSTTSKNPIFSKAQLDNLRMQFPQPPSQVMIVPRRSAQTLLKRPTYMMDDPGAMVSKAPVFYERKKAVYKSPILSRMQTLLKPPHQQFYYSPTKLVKIDSKPHLKAKVELKPPQIETFSSEHKANLLRPMMMKPARNTGFDPGSIVIEKGFKPILRKTVTETVDRSSELLLKDEVKETTTEKYNDNFEPVFIPSYPDRQALNKPSKKKQHLKTKLKPGSLDDAESSKVEKDYTYLQPPTLATPGRRNAKSRSFLNSTASSTPLPDEKVNSSTTEVIQPKREKRFAQSHDSHSHHDHSHHEHEDSESTQSQSSTGEIILANIEYIVLTVVLYYTL